jgi:hypothetical protein
MAGKTIAACVAGYGFSLLVGLAILWPLMDFLFRKIGDKEQLSLHWLAAGVGLVERIIYTTSVAFDSLELVAVWLVMKAAIEWKAEETRSLASFYVYLIGTALSLIIGLAGGAIILALK